jgi:thiamine biosynthesis lipoprotein
MSDRTYPSRAVRAAGTLLLVVGVSCGAPTPSYEVRLAGEALGTVWSVALAAREAPDDSARADLRGRIEQTLDRVDREMSTWRDDAEIVRFNRAEGTAAHPFSPETRRVIAASLEFARETGGAFDPTVGPLVSLWGFGAQPAPDEPTDKALARARQRVGWRHLYWNEEGALVRRLPGIELDLSAIAKGYAVDALVTELARDRPAGILVEIGGEVRAFGTRPDGEPWRVGIDDPLAPGSRLEVVIGLTGAALATSGDYRQARVVEGEVRSHIIDPRTGRPLQNHVASASVVAPTCMEADAVATALMVLGAEAGLAWVEERPWLEALLLIRERDRIVERRGSSGWSRRVAR